MTERLDLQPDKNCCICDRQYYIFFSRLCFVFTKCERSKIKLKELYIRNIISFGLQFNQSLQSQNMYFSTNSFKEICKNLIGCYINNFCLDPQIDEIKLFSNNFLGENQHHQWTLKSCTLQFENLSLMYTCI